MRGVAITNHLVLVQILRRINASLVVGEPQFGLLLTLALTYALKEDRFALGYN